MERLLGDPNVRVRLIAAGSLLNADPENAPAGGVVREALANPAPRVRKSALALIESLGEKAGMFAAAVQRRAGQEDDAEAAGTLARLIQRLSSASEAARA
jgi:HEAT repeat protein